MDHEPEKFCKNALTVKVFNPDPQNLSTSKFLYFNLVMTEKVMMERDKTLHTQQDRM